MLGLSDGFFVAMKQIGGFLYISHDSGRLWRYDGRQLVEVTGTPFAEPVPNSNTNAVSSMAEFNGKMYFGTWGNQVYESVDGSSFTPKGVVRHALELGAVPHQRLGRMARRALRLYERGVQ